MITEEHVILSAGVESSPFKNIDYIEMYVSNAHQAAHYYRTACGFTPTAWMGLETGTRDRASIVVEEGEIRLVLTNALSADSPVADHVKLHGDSVKDMAFRVDDAAATYHEALKRGARPVMEPTLSEDENGQVLKATIGVYGDTVHSFVQRDSYEGCFLPGYQKTTRRKPTFSPRLCTVDHIAVSVEEGELDRWIEFYEKVLQFFLSHQDDIETDLSAMNSKVVQNSSGSIKFPMMEPARGKRKSQIEEYLSYHHGPGAQHVALLTNNIIESVRRLSENDIEFLNAPRAYYDALTDRVGEIDEDLEALSALNILVDRDNWGYLMQVFSKPVQGRPTAFFEIIQRKGARGFGSGNVRALFEALETEQRRRGNL